MFRRALRSPALLKVLDKPIAGQLFHLFERSWFLEKMRCTGNNFQFDVGVRHHPLRVFVHVDHRFVMTTDALGGVPSTRKKFKVETPVWPGFTGSRLAMYSVGAGPYEWAGWIEARSLYGPNAW